MQTAYPGQGQGQGQQHLSGYGGAPPPSATPPPGMTSFPRPGSTGPVSNVGGYRAHGIPVARMREDHMPAGYMPQGKGLHPSQMSQQQFLQGPHHQVPNASGMPHPGVMPNQHMPPQHQHQHQVPAMFQDQLGVQQQQQQQQSASQPIFDSSDFPALGGAGQNAGAQNGSASRSAAYGFAQNAMGGQPPVQVLQQGFSSKVIKEEEFPSLSGTARQQQQQQQQQSIVRPQPMQAVGHNAERERQSSSSSAHENNSVQAHLVRQFSTAQAPPTVAAARAMADSGEKPTEAPQMNSLEERYGLRGLLSVINMLDQDLNVLTLGFDLTSLGLNLNSPDLLYTSFTSPWVESSTPSTAEGETPSSPQNFKLPSCYQMEPPPIHQAHFQKLQLETLFYIFYAMPGDVLQMLAAQELYNRDWIFHKESKHWFTRAPNTEPTVKSKMHEEGSYIYFDVHRWEKMRKDNVVLRYEELLDLKAAMHSASQHGGHSAGMSSQSIVTSQSN